MIPFIPHMDFIRYILLSSLFRWRKWGPILVGKYVTRLWRHDLLSVIGPLITNQALATLALFLFLQSARLVTSQNLQMFCLPEDVSVQGHHDEPERRWWVRERQPRVRRKARRKWSGAFIKHPLLARPRAKCFNTYPASLYLRETWGKRGWNCVPRACLVAQG